MADSDAKTIAQEELESSLGERAHVDVDPAETAEWLSSLHYVLQSKGPERARFLLDQLRDRKPQMEPDQHQKEIELLMIQLARIYQAAEERTATQSDAE